MEGNVFMTKLYIFEECHPSQSTPSYVILLIVKMIFRFSLYGRLRNLQFPLLFCCWLYIIYFLLMVVFICFRCKMCRKLAPCYLKSLSLQALGIDPLCLWHTGFCYFFIKESVGSCQPVHIRLFAWSYCMVLTFSSFWLVLMRDIIIWLGSLSFPVIRYMLWF